MGRYYMGDINGEFWFGIQSSNDADVYGYVGHFEKQYICEECEESCCIDEEDIEMYDINGCCETDDKNHKWIIRDYEGQLEYHFTEEHLDVIKNELNNLKNELKNMVQCSDRTFRYIMRELLKNPDDPDMYDILTDSDKCCDACSSLIARLELGFKIYKCLIENEVCLFWAEC
jgi:hypothetical protein